MLISCDFCRSFPRFTFICVSLKRGGERKGESDLCISVRRGTVLCPLFVLPWYVEFSGNGLLVRALHFRYTLCQFWICVPILDGESAATDRLQHLLDIVNARDMYVWHHGR